jgi:glutathione synthase/RimK-type ligase-like ATP-grasp enzyme
LGRQISQPARRLRRKWPAEPHPGRRLFQNRPMSNPSIALVTAVAARAADEDLAPLESALRNAGADVTVAEWDRSHDWSRFDIALLRSTWDYPQRLVEFLEWAEGVSQKTRLLNPFPMVKWSSDKHYQGDLVKQGVPTVPTKFIEPGERADRRLTELLGEIDAEEFVVKPAVGAGSRDAQRFGRDEQPQAARHALQMLNENRSVLVQPYLSRVDEHGETALVYFEGEFSHAIRKGPLLKRQQGPTTGLFAKEAVTARTPDAAERSVASKALQAAPFGTPLYARVDLIRGQEGEPVVLELELIEPSLFFPFAAGSAERFAAAVVARAKR